MTGEPAEKVVLPRPARPSGQKIGLTARDSGPATWPETAKPPAGAPNVLVVLTDDVGFGSCSTFGGPIPTPVLDALAQGGLSYNRFHTSALCSPTRASLLTGRNPHTVGMGNISHNATGYDGYTSMIPKSAGMVAETLRQNGYLTAAFGKWHLTPEWEVSSTGPFDRWPTGQGFGYFYGFLGADTDQFAPALVENMTPLSPPADDPGYIFETDMANRTIRWITEANALAPESPFFIYYAPGTAHAPHQAPKAWLEKFRGKFDQGWDALREETFARQKRMGIIPPEAELTPRPDSVQSWDSVPQELRPLYARYMEAYAAMLAFCDHEFGRVLDCLRKTGQLDNTLVIFIQGDNGSDATGARHGAFFEQSQLNKMDEDVEYALAHIDEIGGPRAYSKYNAGWGWGTTTPFQYYKMVASHLGGVRNGMVVSWPERIRGRGEIRTQFTHVSDVVPTILEATGIRQPDVLNGVAQKPLDGISFAYSFDDPAREVSPRIQAFEMFQNLGIYKGGWWAGTLPVATPWETPFAAGRDLSERVWELYDLRTDFSQARNLAQERPEILAEMKELFIAEAGRTGILPVHGNTEGTEGRPTPSAQRNRFVFLPGMVRIPESFAPNIVGKSFRIHAEVTLGGNADAGVLLSHGGHGGGYCFYMKDGRPVFHYNATSGRQYSIRAGRALQPGAHRLVADFVADSDAKGTGGTLTILDNGTPIAEGRIEHTHRRWIWECLNVGEDTLTPVTRDYSIAASRFSGTLHQVIFDVGHASAMTASRPFAKEHYPDEKA